MAHYRTDMRFSPEGKIEILREGNGTFLKKSIVFVIHTPPDPEFHGTIELSGSTGSRISGRNCGIGGLPDKPGIVSFEGETEITGSRVMFEHAQGQLELNGQVDPGIG